jgi:positive regulator of sigma E activity
MDSSNCIGQKGVIEGISDGKISVTISRDVACEGCHIQSACNNLGTITRTIVIPYTGNDIHTGEVVKVLMHKKLGLKAVTFAYLLPFLVLIILLFVFDKAGFSEPATGALILLALSFYFLCLYFLRNRLQKIFIYELIKSA